MKTTTELKQQNKINDEEIEQILLTFPSRFRNADIEKCPEDAKKYIFNLEPKTKGLYLHGPVGVGKTFIAYSLLRVIKENGVKGRLINSNLLLKEIREDYSNRAVDKFYQSKFDEWIDYKGILIIDDMGAEKMTDWVLDTFYSLINTRYEKELITIFTSNYNIEQMSERLGDRITSRMVEMCEFYKQEGEDLRLK
jgi:DNA replication protein DnaC